MPEALVPARGQPLSGLRGTPGAPAALEGLGRTLARLHGVAMPGYWRPDPTGRWEDDVAALRRGFVAERAGERGHLRAAGFPPAQIDRMITAIYAPPPDTRPVLCHGDPTPEHIYIDEAGAVSDLIDWGMWCGGFPVDDLADAARVYRRDEFELILRGHGESLADPAFGRQLWTACIGQAIGHLTHHANIGDPAGVRRNARALHTAMQELDSLH
ncbi:MAG: aminoglycoside phosphotransferase family protein [Mycobacteriales bacterium]